MDDDAFETLRRGLRGGAGPDDDGDVDERPRLDARHLAVAGGAILALGLVIVVTSAMRPTGHVASSSFIGGDGAPSTLAPTSTSTAASVPAASQVWPAEAIDVDGTEVRTGGHRWQVGDAGDLVAVGDWDCDGAATPAVVRTGARRLYVFDAWATADAATTATPGPTVPADVTAVEADGCGRARVRTADGRTHVVAVDGAP